jgi:uncharacterized protein (TIGR02246 family)
VSTIPGDPWPAERAIRDVCERISVHWTIGDAHGLAAAWAQDGDHVCLTRVSRIRRGRPALERAWREAFERRPPEYSRGMHVIIDAVRLLAADIAVIDGVLDYSAGIGVTGRHEAASVEPFAAVMQRADGEWQVAASRAGAYTLARKFIRLQPEADASPAPVQDTGDSQTTTSHFGGRNHE